MTNQQRAELASFEGRRVSLALADGSRVDDCELVSAGRHDTSTLWLFAEGSDTFVPVDQVADLWEASRLGDHGVA